jgi:hypothetical protein
MKSKKHYLKDIVKGRSSLKKSLTKLDKDVRMILDLQEPSTVEDVHELIYILYENLWCKYRGKVVRVVPKGKRKREKIKLKENKYTTNNDIKKLLEKRNWPTKYIREAIKELKSNNL